MNPETLVINIIHFCLNLGVWGKAPIQIVVTSLLLLDQEKDKEQRERSRE